MKFPIIWTSCMTNYFAMRYDFSANFCELQPILLCEDFQTVYHNLMQISMFNIINACSC
jgi:hypothetical protein